MKELLFYGQYLFFIFVLKICAVFGKFVAAFLGFPGIVKSTKVIKVFSRVK